MQKRSLCSGILMAKASSVTYDAVAHACRQLFADGKNPTFPQVYTALGNVGSAKIVQGYINDWRREMADAVGAGEPPAVPGVPKEAVSAWLEFLPKLWPSLFRAAQAEFDERKGEIEAQLEAERVAMAEQIQSARDTAKAAESLLQSVETDLSVLRAKYQDLSDKAADLTARLAQEADARQRLEAELAEERRDAALKEERFNNRMAEMESRMDAMRREHADVARNERRAREEELETMRQRHQADLTRRDETITSLRAQVSEKVESLAGMRAERAEFAAKAAQQADENQRLNAVLADLQAQLRVAGKDQSAAEARAAAMDEFRKAETKRAEHLAETLEAANRTINELRDIARKANSDQPNK